jgi:hypothetical protein
MILLGLAALVLLLYRQVEKAYQEGIGGQSGGLLPGVNAPDIEVTFDKRDQPLAFPAADELAILAFVSTDCDACGSLVTALDRQVDFRGTVLGLVNGEKNSRFPPKHLSRVRLLWLAHPPDVIRSYGASTVPMVYVVRGRTILASKVVATASGVERLLEEAQVYETSVSDVGLAAPSGAAI